MGMSLQTYRRDANPFETDTKGRLFGLDVSINWPTNRNWQTTALDSWKATQLNLPRQKSVNMEMLILCFWCWRVAVAMAVVTGITLSSPTSERCCHRV